MNEDELAANAEGAAEEEPFAPLPAGAMFCGAYVPAPALGPIERLDLLEKRVSELERAMIPANAMIRAKITNTDPAMPGQE